MTDILEAAKVLGVAEPPSGIMSDVHYLSLVHRGFPIRSLERIAHAIAPGDATFKYRIVSRATLARLKTKSPKKLNASQSVVVSRLASVWHTAIQVWKSEDEARAFLYRSHPLLEGKRPIDLVLENELGAQIVRDVLGRLENGSAV